MAWLLGETPPPAPRPATRDEALSLPAFGRGVELIASCVAGVAIRAHRFAPKLGIWAELADQPQILTEPDPQTTPWHWRFGVVKDMVEAGNHISLLGDLDYRTGRPGWLVPLPVEHLGLIEDPGRPGWWAFVYGSVLLDPSEVLHISAGNRSGEILGQGVIGQYRHQLGQQLTAEEWAGRYLHGGGLPPAIIQFRGEPPADRKRDFKDNWRRMTDTGEAMLLPADAVVTPLQSDAQRQQLVEARNWNSHLSAMVLGIPAHMLNIDGPTMTYQNAEGIDIAWVRDTVDRWAQPMLGALTKWLLPNGVEARCAWGQRARTDLKTQAEVAKLLVDAGILTKDEGRQMIGYGPLALSTSAGSTPEGIPNLGADVNREGVEC